MDHVDYNNKLPGRVEVWILLLVLTCLVFA